VPRKLTQKAHQIHLPGMEPYADALDALQTAGREERGAVFTRREVVEFILDLVGYRVERPLHRLRLLEPSCGDGNFIVVAVERLLDAWAGSADRMKDPVAQLADSLVAVELHAATLKRTRNQLKGILEGAGLTGRQSTALLDQWLVQGDFLLVPLSSRFDCVVGNPPYVRQEVIPDALIAEYRARYRTVFDRADLYIPFIERSLGLLADGGNLGFICADRWMKNRYGGPLRRMVAANYHLKAYIDMVDTPAFLTDVMAYPAITVIAKAKSGVTRTARRPAISRPELQVLARDLTSQTLPPESKVKEVTGVVSEAEPWILESSDQLSIIRRLEKDFPQIEEAGCKVGIGVATGADKAFIAAYDDLDVEDDRKLPLATTRDIVSGEVAWQGLGIINPFIDGGGVADLSRYPRLKRYLEARRDQISKRHIAKKSPANWYRTIDRIYPALAKTPKLLIPDIKGEAHIVYENGRLYPHHNLYYITSTEWDLKALQAVLRSGIARLFVSIYSTQMRGGYLRFQAQYLRRIRLPRWNDVAEKIKKKLMKAAKEGDVSSCNEAAFELYRLSSADQAVLGRIGEG